MDQETRDKELLTRHMELKESLNELNITLASMKVSIEDHIRRTELAEQRIEALQSETIRMDKQLTRWTGAVTVSGWIVSTVIAIGMLVLRFI